MEFEWDENKRLEVLQKRGIDLLRAALIFDGAVLTKRDPRSKYGEDRYISIGTVEEEYFVIVHTERADTRRLITAWRAGRAARRRYQARFP